MASKTSIYERLVSDRDEILRLARQHGATRVRVFGSVARGASPESDVDFLLDLRPGTSLLDLVAVKQDLEELLSRSVDVATEGSLSPYMRDAVLGEAVDL